MKSPWFEVSNPSRSISFGDQHSLPYCPFCGTDYVSPVGEAKAVDFESIAGEVVDQYEQHFKCTKPWCRTEFDIIFRPRWMRNVVVPEDVLASLDTQPLFPLSD
jgi:hypothetical protein